MESEPPPRAGPAAETWVASPAILRISLTGRRKHRLIPVRLLLFALMSAQTPIELPSLRTTYSRTFDNHDGTYTAEIRASVTQALSYEDTMRCDNSGHLMMYIDRNGVRWYYSFGPEIMYGYSSQTNRGWMQFDLSPIPDSCQIVRAACDWYQYEIEGGSNMETEVRSVNVHPDSVTPGWFYTAIGDGPVVSARMAHAYVGWVHRVLNDRGLFEIGVRLKQDRLVLGVLVLQWGQIATACGYSDSTLPPRLTVTYSPPFGVDIQACSLQTSRPLMAMDTATLGAVFTNIGVLRAESISVKATIGDRLVDSTWIQSLEPGQDTLIRLQVTLPDSIEGLYGVRLVAHNPWDYDRSNDTTPFSQHHVFRRYTKMLAGFEGDSWPPENWLLVNGGNPLQSWHRTLNVSHVGNAAALAAGYGDYDNDDWLISDTLSLSPYETDSVGFFVRTDALLPYGQRMDVWALSGPTPADTLALLSSRGYRSTEWEKVRVDLEQCGLLLRRIGFRTQKIALGHAVCVDDVHLVRVPVPGFAEGEQPDALQQVRCLSNPARGAAQLSLHLSRPGTLTVTDVTGRHVAAISVPAGGSIQTLPALRNGVYIIRLRSGTRMEAQKLVTQQ